MPDNFDKGEIIIYTAKDGSINLDVRLENETIWLTQDLIVKLFESSKANVSEHIKHIFEEGELDKNSTVRNFRTVRKEGNREVTRNLEYYNLDMIISVGYRINSSRATQFRIWATSVLKEYIIKGYALNEKRLKEQQNQIITLKNSIALMERGLIEQIENLDTAKEVARILNNFALGLNLLDDYDHKLLDKKGINSTKAKKISKDEFLKIINDMKADFKSDIFAQPKDNSFDSSINQIYQTFDGVELYPTLEEKAATLLYLIVKNHSFTDGNKRIAASCFLYFLDKNDMLFKNDEPLIDNSALFSLTLLIAISKPEEMETIKQIIISILNRRKI